MTDEELHRHLLARQGSRRDLSTPVLVLDRDRLDRNIAAMARFAAGSGLKLRPHAKTHKSVAIARRQIAAGAVGQCCAKLGEAEALAEGGIAGILITSPIVAAPAVERLAALNERCDGLMCVVDSEQGALAIARAVAARVGKPLAVLIDIDPGIHRTGVAGAAEAVELHRAILAQPELQYGGVQYYCGSQQHIAAFAEREAAVLDRLDHLRTVLAALEAAGGRAPIVSGGGTGTHRIDAAAGVFTELQVGSYVFMDDQYGACALTEEGSSPFETALMIDTRVISANSPGLVTVDAGLKAMATDAGRPRILAGASDGTAYHFMGDEHGALVHDGALPALDDRVTLAVPHCDPTVNLYDFYHIVSGETLVEIWPVSARGRSR